MEILIGFLILAVLALIIYLIVLKGRESARMAAYAQQATVHAQQQFEQWRATEIATVQKQQNEIAHREAAVNLARWKSDYEQQIRQEAVKKSHDVITGKVTEQLVPYLPSFRYNPRDARFIGSPVDFVVFDGLSAGEVRQVVFLEVKTGASSLNKREKQVRSVVDSRAVKWEELRVDPQLVQTRPKALAASFGTIDEDEPALRIYSPEGSYIVGEAIVHHIFGRGRVIAIQHNKMEVQFLTQGIKYLVHKS